MQKKIWFISIQKHFPSLYPREVTQPFQYKNNKYSLKYLLLTINIKFNSHEMFFKIYTCACYGGV